MQSFSELRVPDREEVDSIADDLGVPERMKHDFISWITDLAKDINEARLNPSTLDIPTPTTRYPLKSAAQALGKAHAAISSVMLLQDMEHSTDLHGSLAVLLGRGGSDRLTAMSAVLSQVDSKTEPLASVFQMAVENHTNCRASGYGAPFHDLSSLLAILEHLVARERPAFASLGGRPKDRLRAYVLKDLKALYQSTFVKRATTAPGGKYVRLCQHVFDSFGMSTEGLDEAAKRVLKSTANSRSAQPRGPKPPL